MLTEAMTMAKLEEYAQMFADAVRRKDYGVAHNLYNMASTVAVFMELNDQQMKKLFGNWDSDDGTGKDTALDDGLFTRYDTKLVGWKCCIMRHQAYEDQALRVAGEPVRYYSDPDYCARCKKRDVRHWDASMLD